VDRSEGFKPPGVLDFSENVTILGEKGTLSDSARLVIHYLRRLVQADQLYNKRLTRDYQLSQPQLICLMALRERGPMSSTKLARFAHLDNSTITGIIDRLTRKGLVERHRERRDRRVVTLYLTDKGSELALQAPPPIPESVLNGLDRLSGHERADLIKALATLVAMFSEDQEE
jgi:DNA-binding MarR family transcriptional regulator